MKTLLLLTTILLTITSVSAETGIASYYTVSTNGTRTASGIPFKDTALTAAHKTLKLGTLVNVTCLNTNKSVVVKITDRGPYVRGRVIDLSLAAAKAIGLTYKKGITKVQLEIVK